MKRNILAAGLITSIIATSASADMMATSETDLNLRSAPTPDAEIIGVIPQSAEVTVDGCIEASNWCSVTHDGTAGWAYGAYLSTNVGDAHAILAENRDKVKVKVVTYEQGSDADSVVAGGAAGAIVGGVLGGPVGAALGAAAGSAAGDSADPSEEVIAYARDTEVTAVYVNGEVVKGATLPEGLDLTTVPNSDYTLVYVNGVKVLVDPETRRIGYIIR